VTDADAVADSFSGERLPAGAPEKVELIGSVCLRHPAAASRNGS
jgi:hypothetical protein